MSTLAGSATAGVVSAGKKVAALLRQKFSESEDSEALSALDRVLDPPFTDDHLDLLASNISRYESDTDFLSQLTNLVEEWKSVGGSIQLANQRAEGTGHVQVANVSEHSSVTIESDWKAGREPENS
jgi:hypothetical protein